MKISTHLSLAFSLIASAIFVVFGVTVYWFAANHRISEFKERLEERVLLTEKIFLENTLFSASELELLKVQFSNTLAQETEEIIEVKLDEDPNVKYKYPPSVIRKFIDEPTQYFNYGNRQGLSKQFIIDKKEYIVIVSAIDESGLRNLDFLKSRIAMLIIIGIPLLFVGSFAITKQALLPLTLKIKHANAIGASNLHQRLKVINPEDEIGKLAIAFNNLLDRLERSFEAQKAFISNASHEIRNPLTAIIGEAEIAVSKSRAPKEYAESLNHILFEAETLNTTVSNLLQLSKITANDGGVIFVPIVFNEFLTEVKTSFDFVNPQNQLQLQFKEKALNIDGNKVLLKTAFFNIFENACKFSSNGKVEVKVSIRGNQLSIIIEDKGIGISKTDISKIKAPFYRGNNTLQIKGSGIGLSLTDKIVALHKGKLSVESELGEGTKVNITLPLCDNHSASQG